MAQAVQVTPETHPFIEIDEDGSVTAWPVAELEDANGHRARATTLEQLFKLRKYAWTTREESGIGQGVLVPSDRPWPAEAELAAEEGWL